MEVSIPRMFPSKTWIPPDSSPEETLDEAFIKDGVRDTEPFDKKKRKCARDFVSLLWSCARHGMIFVTFLVIIYFGLNFVLNYGNKQVLLAFNYPFFLIVVGTLCYAPVSLALMCLGVSKFPDMNSVRSSLSLVAIIGCLHGLGTGLQNASLGSGMSVALNQVVKACTPAITLVASCLLEGTRYHVSLVICTALSIVGCAMAIVVIPSSNNHLIVTTSANVSSVHSFFFAPNSLLSPGALLGVFSLVLGGIEGVLASICMRRHRLHPSHLTLLLSPTAFLTSFLFFAVFEVGPPLLSDLSLRAAPIGAEIFILSICAAAYGYVHNSLISRTGAHYTNLLGTAKLALVVAASAVALERPEMRRVTPVNVAGIILTLVSFAAYSWLKSSHPPNVDDKTSSEDVALKKPEEKE